MKKSSYNEWNADAIRNYVKRATDVKNVYLSEIATSEAPVQFNSNSKLNGVLSVGTLPVIDCGEACKDCKNGCYAVRHTAGRNAQNLRRCAKNSAILQMDRARFFAEVEHISKLTRVFRWHTEGEVKDADYFKRVVNVAAAVPGTAFLLFTKRADLVNGFIQAGGIIPDNLHVLLSAWHDIAEVNNPYNLPISARFQRSARKISPRI